MYIAHFIRDAGDPLHKFIDLRWIYKLWWVRSCFAIAAIAAITNASKLHFCVVRFRGIVQSCSARFRAPLGMQPCTHIRKVRRRSSTPARRWLHIIKYL